MTEFHQRMPRHPFFNDDRDDSVHDDAGDDHVNDDKILRMMILDLTLLMHF